MDFALSYCPDAIQCPLNPGNSTSPKFGLLWAPSAWLSVRGTYGESFRAPFLNQLDPTNGINQIALTTIQGVPTFLLNPFGPSPDLEPETAQSYTLGLDIQPDGGQVQLGVTYFNIDYEDRLASAIASEVAANPDRFPEVFIRPTTAAQIEEILRSTRNVSNRSSVNLSDPAAAAVQLLALPNFAILDTRLRNQSSTRIDGVDLSVTSGADTAWGDVQFGAQVTYVLDYTEQTAEGSAVRTIVDTVLRPVDLRGRAFVNLSAGSFDGALSVNYVDDYSNPLGVGAEDVESWTTADLVLAYEYQGRSDFLSGTTFNLSVQNLFDQDPPPVARGAVANTALISPVGFDPANANPLGRFVALGFSKSW